RCANNNQNTESSKSYTHKTDDSLASQHANNNDIRRRDAGSTTYLKSNELPAAAKATRIRVCLILLTPSSGEIVFSVAMIRAQGIAVSRIIVSERFIYLFAQAVDETNRNRDVLRRRSVAMEVLTRRDYFLPHAVCVI
ncbi:hypothetical protein K0M31_011935, partial [Melipona bicolor]